MYPRKQPSRRLRKYSTSSYNYTPLSNSYLSMTLLYHTFVNKSRRSLVYHLQPVAVYHQCEALYIIKPQGNTRWRVMRYKGGSPPLMICTTLRAAMICQAYGKPQSSASSLRGTPTAAWIKKFDKSKLVEFFVTDGFEPART